MTTTTTISSRAATEGQAPRPLPLWASIPIILVCLTAGGWIIHWYVGSHLNADEAHVLGDVPARVPAVFRPGNNKPGGGNWNWLVGGGGRGIRQQQPGNGRDAYEAFTEHARATFINNAKGQPGVNLTYGASQQAYAFVPDDVRKTIYATDRLVKDNKYTEAIKLSQADVGQLRRLSRPAMTVVPADRSTLLTDFAAYKAAKPDARAAAQTKLLADLDAVAQRSQEPTRQAMTEAAAKINAIVSTAQWAQLKAMGLMP
jgi:hypothetical protein